MDWLHVLTIAGSTVGACWWMRKESKEDMQIIMSDMKRMSDQFAQESKDFHGRLCTLEERYLQMMQKHLENKK